MKISDRKKRILASVAGRLTLKSELTLDRDLEAATTHADLDVIEDSLDSDEAVAEDDGFCD